MDGGFAVAITALGIVATVVGGLIWVVKFLFTKNDKTLNNLATSIEKSAKASTALHDSLKKRDARDHAFQQGVVRSLEHVTKTLERIDQKEDQTLAAVKAVANSLSGGKGQD